MRSLCVERLDLIGIENIGNGDVLPSWFIIEDILVRKDMDTAVTEREADIAVVRFDACADEVQSLVIKGLLRIRSLHLHEYQARKILHIPEHVREFQLFPCPRLKIMRGILRHRLFPGGAFVSLIPLIERNQFAVRTGHKSVCPVIELTLAVGPEIVHLPGSAVHAHLVERREGRRKRVIALCVQAVDGIENIAIAIFQRLQFKALLHRQGELRGKRCRALLKEPQKRVHFTPGEEVVLVVIGIDAFAGSILHIKPRPILLREPCDRDIVAVILREVVYLNEPLNIIQKAMAFPECALFAGIQHLIRTLDRSILQFCLELIDMVPQGTRLIQIHGGEPAVERDYLRGLNRFRRIRIAVIRDAAIDRSVRLCRFIIPRSASGRRYQVWPALRLFHMLSAAAAANSQQHHGHGQWDQNQPSHTFHLSPPSKASSISVASPSCDSIVSVWWKTIPSLSSGFTNTLK